MGKPACAKFLTRRPINCASAAASVRALGHGAVSVFEGRVRDREAGVRISWMNYEVYPALAEREMARICRQARRKWKASVYLRHRVGRVPAGAPAIVIACAAKHRREAFLACRFIIDSVKNDVPIWKAGFARKKAR